MKIILASMGLLATGIAFMQDHEYEIDVRRLQGVTQNGESYIVTDKGTFNDGSDIIRRTTNGAYYKATVSGLNLPALGFTQEIVGVERIDNTVYVEKESALNKVGKALTKRVAGDDMYDLISQLTD